MDIDDLADFHLCHCLVKSQDHHACSADKRERFAAVIRRIELRAVVKGSPVVDADALSGVPAFHGITGASAAAAAVVFTAVIVAVSAAALVVVVVAVASAALVVFTVVMVAALVPLAMAVVVAVRACVDQFALEVRFDRLIRVAGCACADFDPRIAESVQRSAADDLICLIYAALGSTGILNDLILVESTYSLVLSVLFILSHALVKRNLDSFLFSVVHLW